MSVRDFAAHLGVNDAAVSNWERRGDKATLRYETQQLLDADLAAAPHDVHERFGLLLRIEPLAQGRADSKTATPAVVDPLEGIVELGDRSAARSASLLTGTYGSQEPVVKAMPNAAALRALRSFVSSAARTFVLKGPPGSGKTFFVQDAGRELAGAVDLQLHSVDTWVMSELDLAAEILRYASLSAGDDALLTLERASEQLTKPCVVVIDGINAPENLYPIGRQLDAVIRQVKSSDLRFMLVIRTPPDGDLTAFPILASSIFETPGKSSGSSYVTEPWDIATASDIWDRSRETDREPRFRDLPASVQALARLPLYMRLIKAGGNTGTASDLNAYRLVDHCVTNILVASQQDGAKAFRTLAKLAEADSPHLVPSQLNADRAPTVHGDVAKIVTDQLPRLSNLVHLTASGKPVFSHDVFREYFLAKRIAGLMLEHGRSVKTVAALNELASQASKSATARGIFEFVVFAVDDQSPELAGMVALAPTVAIETTLPMMLALAIDGARFANVEVLRRAASRCNSDNGIELARSLLMHPALSLALGDEYEEWLLSLLRQFGSAVWFDVSRHIENRFEFDVTTRFLSRLNLDTGEEATFVARHYFLFIESDSAHAELVEQLAGHLDWRVRMALAQGLLQGKHASAQLVGKIMERLAEDPDYKVRAAVAMALGKHGPAASQRHLARMLGDPNWHVRACVLEGTYSRQLSSPELGVAREALNIVQAEPTWHACPDHVAKLLEKLRLLEPTSYPVAHGPAVAHALFGLLRELRTGWIDLPDEIRDLLISEGRRSASWLVNRESTILGNADKRVGSAKGPLTLRQTFRRLRGSRSVQIALDLHDLDRAVEVAIAAATAGADLIEIGDPLIKANGLRAVEVIKQSVPDAAIVVEMMSADWGRDQVELAAEAGADVVLLIGPATTASVSAAVEAGRRLGVAIVLDIPASHTTESWVRNMERAGVDGFAVTTNIDLGVGVHPPLTKARSVRGWTRLPIAVSGGFSATDYAIIDSTDWDVMIVGRSVAEAVQPTQAAREIVNMIHTRRVRAFD